jgi:hypothetical protein
MALHSYAPAFLTLAVRGGVGPPTVWDLCSSVAAPDTVFSVGEDGCAMAWKLDADKVLLSDEVRV